MIIKNLVMESKHSLAAADSLRQFLVLTSHAVGAFRPITAVGATWAYNLFAYMLVFVIAALQQGRWQGDLVLTARAGNSNCCLCDFHCRLHITDHGNLVNFPRDASMLQLLQAVLSTRLSTLNWLPCVLLLKKPRLARSKHSWR